MRNSKTAATAVSRLQNLHRVSSHEQNIIFQSHSIKYVHIILKLLTLFGINYPYFHFNTPRQSAHRFLFSTKAYYKLASRIYQLLLNAA